MRKPLILGNWKMNQSLEDLETYLKKLETSYSSMPLDKADFGFAPTCPLIYSAKDKLKKIGASDVWIGAQNVYYESKGAFTGELSTEILESVGTDFVIIAHSERRHIFGETNEFIAKKVKKVLSSNLKLVFCVGETKEERENGKAESVVYEQVVSALDSLDNFDTDKIIIAYEPVWAIGTGLTASPEDADSMHLFIRKTLEKLYDKSVADSVRILYGGSVKPNNVKELMKKENIDGALVGGASLDFSSFLDILKGAVEV